MTGDNWLFFRNWYDDLITKIRRKGQLMEQFSEKQGIRQGEVWSPTAYKIFINNMLQTFERNQFGSFIGTIYCGIPTVADDVTLITSDPEELQTMQNVQSAHANRQRYILSEKKSNILVLNDSANRVWFLN